MSTLPTRGPVQGTPVVRVTSKNGESTYFMYNQMYEKVVWTSNEHDGALMVVKMQADVAPDEQVPEMLASFGKDTWESIIDFPDGDHVVE